MRKFIESARLFKLKASQRSNIGPLPRIGLQLYNGFLLDSYDIFSEKMSHTAYMYMPPFTGIVAPVT